MHLKKYVLQRFYSFEQLITLGISQIVTVEKLGDFEPIVPSAFLTEALKRFAPLATAINTEKARSEYLIAPTNKKRAIASIQRVRSPIDC